MKKLLPILVFLFIAESSYAQNWNCFTPGINQYFVNKAGYVRGMRLDSVSYSGNDLVYYPFKTPRGNYYDWTAPLDSTGGSWLGGKVVRKADGTFLFDNNWGDTVVLKTRAAVGDSWVFYRDSSTYHYEAEVTALDTMSVMGILDSVRRITINAIDGSNMNPADSLHGFEILLSKSYGFVQVFDLYTFPYHPHDTVYAQGFDYFLDMSLESYHPGAHRSLFRITDYSYVSADHQKDLQVGDVYYYGESLGGSIWTAPPYYNYFMDTIRQVTTTNNNTEYISSGWVATMGQFNGYDIEYFDTMPACTYCFEIDITLMPEEKKQSVHWYYFPGDTSYCSPAPLYRFSMCYVSEEFVYFSGLGIGSFAVDYKGGLGMVRAGGRDGDLYVYDRRLLYYNKNGFDCGLFVFPDTTVDVQLNVGNITGAGLKVYPNPAQEQLTVETPLADYTLSLLNTLGQVVYARTSCTGKHSINVRSFPNGMYYLKIETPEHETINRKIIMQN